MSAATDPQPEPQAAPSTSPPKRKRRTFTMSDAAYETLSAAALDGDGNRSGQLERYILDAAASVNLDVDTYAALVNAAEAAEVAPARLLADYVRNAPTSVALDAATHAALVNIAEAAEVEPPRVVTDCIRRYDDVVTLAARNPRRAGIPGRGLPHGSGAAG